MRFGIHLAAQDLFRAGNRQRSDLLAQLLARPLRFLLDIGFGGGSFAVAFGLGRNFRFLDHLRSALFGLRDDLRRTRARLLDRLLGLLARQLKRLFALLACGESVSDLLLARLDRAQQRRPDELDREPDEKRKRNGLRDQREIETHCVPLRGGWSAIQRITASRGLANANIIANPTPMMKDASIKPSSRNTFACRELVSSGWRAAASRKRLHMTPTPIQAPAAPTPIMRPIPMPV